MKKLADAEAVEQALTIALEGAQKVFVAALDGMAAARVGEFCCGGHSVQNLAAAITLLRAAMSGLERHMSRENLHEAIAFADLVADRLASQLAATTTHHASENTEH